MANFATYVIVVVCCVVNSVLCHPVNNEPQCYSKFDYDVKLLEKMVNLEHRVNLSERLLRDEIINLEADKKRLEENVDSLSKQLTEEQERATKEIKLKSEEVDAKLRETMLANFSQLADRTTADQKAFADGVETSLAGLELKMNTSLQAFAEKAVKPAVAFYMRYTGTNSPGTNAMLKFSTAFVNTNNVYDTQTGLFTTPVSGVYVFSVQICGYTSRSINFRIYVNDDMISDTTEYDNDSNSHCTSTNAVAMLDVGDKVCVKTGPNTSSGNTLVSTTYSWSTFMGTLVH